MAIFDEATALLADRDVENAVSTLVLRARKYGLWLVLGGQDWKASSLSTRIRNQLASRFQFKAMSASRSRVLLQQSGAETLDVPGRALAILPGRELLKLQAPMVSENALLSELTGDGPQAELPEVGQDDSDTENPEQVAHIQYLADEGLTPSKIAREVYGYANGRTVERVKNVLDRATTTKYDDKG